MRWVYRRVQESTVADHLHAVVLPTEVYLCKQLAAVRACCHAASHRRRL